VVGHTGVAADLPLLLRNVMLRRARAVLTDFRMQDDVPASVVVNMLRAERALSPAFDVTERQSGVRPNAH
jgi:hypothetical protein